MSGLGVVSVGVGVGVGVGWVQATASIAPDVQRRSQPKTDRIRLIIVRMAARGNPLKPRSHYVETHPTRHYSRIV